MSITPRPIFCKRLFILEIAVRVVVISQKSERKLDADIQNFKKVTTSSWILNPYNRLSVAFRFNLSKPADRGK